MVTNLKIQIALELFPLDSQIQVNVQLAHIICFTSVTLSVFQIVCWATSKQPPTIEINTTTTTSAWHEHQQN